MELLSPAGNFKAFIGCINAGCDAIYLGGSRFGARAYADNFSDEEIIEAIRIAHIYNKKVYLTVNTLIKDTEFDDVIDYINLFYQAGLDACIVQDLGLISVFPKLFPNMECHVSTQGFSTSIESVRFYKELGAKRVVLARELSLDEISFIKENEDIELETFIHGAMCYSYSGECLFSSCLGGRSGNRGRCAGPCRLPYKYLDCLSNNTSSNYILSMKDQCTLMILPKLIDAGIDSLKIEGRMKKPEYSAFVTAMYRKYIDLYINNPSAYKVDKLDLDLLRHMYLRSEISDGYYFKKNGKDMLTLSNPAYLGTDESLMKDVENKYLSSLNKISVDISVYAYKDSPLTMNYSVGDITAVACSVNNIDKANNRPTGIDDIKKQIVKLGDTPFIAGNVSIDMEDDIFLPVKTINEVRRECINTLMNLLIENNGFDVSRLTLSVASNNNRIPARDNIRPLIIFLSGDSCKNFLFDEKYDYAAPIETLSGLNIDSSHIFGLLPDVIRNNDLYYLEKLIEKAISLNIKGLIVRNFEQMPVIKKLNYKGIVISSAELYAYNKKSKNVLLEDFDNFILPFELSKKEIKNVANENALIFAYGKLPLMHTSNCVVKTNEGCKKNAGLSFSYIKDRMNVKFPVYRDCNVCSNIIFNSVPVSLLDEKEYLDKYIPVLFFSDENQDTINKVIYSFEKKEQISSPFTKAYFNRGVE